LNPARLPFPALFTFAMLKTYAAIALIGIATIANAIPENQIPLSKASSTGDQLQSMTLQHQYIHNPEKEYSLERTEMTTATGLPIQLKSYADIYLLPPSGYVRQLKEARTPRSMFEVFDQNQYNWQPHLGHLPNVRSRETVLALAQMANNAYSPDEKGSDWRDMDENWKVVRLNIGIRSSPLASSCSLLYLSMVEWIVWI
jgi:putative lipase involved disintegration of autophagic bodies